MLSTLQLFRLLFWVQWRSFVARWRGAWQKSPAMLFILGGFVFGYLALGYWLFFAGLNFLYRFPLVGSLLSQRLLYLVFGFFFIMLVFSNLIIGYSTLFKSRETTWLLSLPLPPRNIYRWKFLEALAVSSWALLFLSAPLMLAYGRVHEAPPIFFLRDRPRLRAVRHHPGPARLVGGRFPGARPRPARREEHRPGRRAGASSPCSSPASSR